jgi:hypothetical protein
LNGASKERIIAVPWYYFIAHFFAGAFLANGVPHFVQGICGNKFQTPFASPPGVGESSALVNVLWGIANFVIAAVLLRYFFVPLPRPLGALIAFALGLIIAAVWLAHHFGKVRNAAPHP